MFTPRSSQRKRLLRSSAGNDLAGMMLNSLPQELLALVIANLCLVRGVARVCRAFRDATNASEAAAKRTGAGHAGHTKSVSAVAVTPGGHVVTGSHDFTVKIWIERTDGSRDMKCIRTIDMSDGVGYGRAHPVINAIALMPGAARLAIASGWDRVDIHSLVSGDRLAGVGGHPAAFDGPEPLCVAAIPDGEHFVVGDGGGSHMYEVQTGTSGAGHLRLCNSSDRNYIQTVVAHGDDDAPGEVHAIAVSRSGRHIVTGSADGLLKVWGFNKRDGRIDVDDDSEVDDDDDSGPRVFPCREPLAVCDDDDDRDSPILSVAISDTGRILSGSSRRDHGGTCCSAACKTLQSSMDPLRRPRSGPFAQRTIGHFGLAC